MLKKEELYDKVIDVRRVSVSVMFLAIVFWEVVRIV